MASRFRTVAEFLDAQPDEVREKAENLRTLVMDAAPRLTEIVKWSSPSYTLDGQDRLTINVGRGGAVLLVLHRGTDEAETKGAASSFTGDPLGLLTWHSDIRATLPANAEPGAARAVVREWVAG